MENLLYYPYISIDKTPWLYKTLLYCDSLYTITPFEFLDNPSNFDGHMRLLLSEGLVKPISPLSEIGDPRVFENNFIRIIKRHHLEFSTLGNRRRNIPNRMIDNARRGLTQIHFDKVSNNIKNFLIEHNFAENDSNNWLNVREDIAREYMYYLASTIGNVSGYSITTDSKENFSPLYDKYRIPRRKDFSISNNNKESLIKTYFLEGIFNIPQDIKNIEEIITFKERNQNELQNFQRLVKETISYASDLSQENDYQWIEEKIKHLSEEKAILKEKMEKCWIVRDIGSLIWYLPVANQLLNKLDNEPMIHINDSISYATTLVKGVFDVYKNREHRNKQFNNNPLTYVIKTEKKFM